MMTPEEDLEDARMDMAAAAWRIAHLAGQDALIEDLQALLFLVSTQNLDALLEPLQ